MALFASFPLFSHLFAGDGSFRTLYLPENGFAADGLNFEHDYFMVAIAIDSRLSPAPAKIYRWYSDKYNKIIKNFYQVQIFLLIIFDY